MNFTSSLRGSGLSALVALIALLGSPLPAASLAGDYRLQDTYSSSAGAIGPLATVGAAADLSFTSSVVFGQPQRVLTLANAGSTHGVRAQTNPFLSSTNYSVVLLASFNFTLGSAVASKVLDFKNQSADAGLYLNQATGLIAFNGVTPLPLGGTPVVAGNYTQLVLTRDGTSGVTTLYQDGAPAFQFTDTGGLAVLGDASATGNSFLTFFADDSANVTGGIMNESSVGNIARIRFYDGVLTAAEVAGLDTTVVPEPSTWILLAAGAGVMAGAARRRAGRR